MIAADALLPNLRDFLPRQRWYSGIEPPASVEASWSDVLAGPWPALVQMVVEADGVRYQLMVGLRPLDDRHDFLRGHDDAVLGETGTESGPALAYEGTIDAELALVLLDRVSSGSESAQRVHPVGVEQSNTSLVYDDRLILKVFRRLQPGPNPEVEVTEALAAVGFEHVAAPLATMTFDGSHLAVLQPYLLGGTEGWAMALTSLRDLFGVHDTQPVPVIDPNAPPPPEPDPGEAGGDFSGEAERLGVVTAEMHIALAEAFGSQPGDPAEWADSIVAQAAALPGGDLDPAAAAAVLDDLRSVPDPGIATRVHGDYHLGQVLRTDSGWFVLDFEGEPTRTIDERRRPTSPLRDVAGMLRSLHYASIAGLADRKEVGLAGAWEDRNRQAFLDGYLGAAAKGDVLPADEVSVQIVLRAFELEKAVYELAYERAHRPDWVGIPRTALRRITAERANRQGPSGGQRQ
ncbi:MAG: maltokinase N-terminal cap-like domain-containing protein [Acidimicrobiales bacterium]